MENYLIYIVGIVAAVNIFFGSYLVLKLKKYFNHILGLSGGIMIGIVGFEVIPEIIELGEHGEMKLFSFFFVIGILLFHTISYYFPLHEHGHHNEDHDHDHKKHHHNGLGIYGAGLIIIHSFLDGLSIGIAFLANTQLGLAVSAAVLAHNFSDGINTTSSLVLGSYSKLKTRIIICINMIAPISGILFARLFNIDTSVLIAFLSFFAGSILYFAISDILPIAHNDKKQKLPIFITILGVLLVGILSTYLHSH